MQDISTSRFLRHKERNWIVLPNRFLHTKNASRTYFDKKFSIGHFVEQVEDIKDFTNFCSIEATIGPKIIKKQKTNAAQSAHKAYVFNNCGQSQKNGNNQSTETCLGLGFLVFALEEEKEDDLQSSCLVKFCKR